MAVVSVERKVSDGYSEAGADGSLTLNYSVNLGSKNDGAGVALASTLLPQYGDVLTSWEPTFPNSGRFKCITRTPTTFPRNPLWVDVACVFSTRFGEGQSGPSLSAGGVPLDRGQVATSRRTQVSSSSRDVEVPFDKDRDGTLVRNTAGDQFYPKLTTTVRQTVYTIQYADPSPPSWIYTEKKYTNGTAFTIRGKRWAQETLLIDAVSVSEEEDSHGEVFNNVTIVVIGDARGHKREVLNEGIWHFPNGGRSATEKRRCRINGQDVDSPVPLDSDGIQITLLELDADPISVPHYLSLAEYPTANFTAYLPSVS